MLSQVFLIEAMVRVLRSGLSRPPRKSQALLEIVAQLVVIFQEIFADARPLSNLEQSQVFHE
jgi:hypothetical protein